MISLKVSGAETMNDPFATLASPSLKSNVPSICDALSWEYVSPGKWEIKSVVGVRECWTSAAYARQQRPLLASDYKIPS